MCVLTPGFRNSNLIIPPAVSEFIKNEHYNRYHGYPYYPKLFARDYQSGSFEQLGITPYKASFDDMLYGGDFLYDKIRLFSTAVRKCNVNTHVWEVFNVQGGFFYGLGLTTDVINDSILQIHTFCYEFLHDQHSVKNGIIDVIQVAEYNRLNQKIEGFPKSQLTDGSH